MASLALRDFVARIAALVERTEDETTLLAEGAVALRALIAVDDWLPAAYAHPHPDHYQQYLLYADPRERFSVVSFVWGPGQGTPIHDHTVWGLVGVLRGAEYAQAYRRTQDGRLVEDGVALHLTPGTVAPVSPRLGDIHAVRNAYADRPSISIHVYGGNIGGLERSVYPPDAAPRRFVSRYANTQLPNLWLEPRETPLP